MSENRMGQATAEEIREIERIFAEIPDRRRRASAQRKQAATSSLDEFEALAEEYAIRKDSPVHPVCVSMPDQVNAAGGDPAPSSGPAVPYPPPFRGVMHDVVQAALAVSPKPQPDLCTLSALMGMAASIHGDYHLPSGMRLNLYGCGVAGTGEGKDHPRSIAIAISQAAQGKLIGKPASGPGLEDCLVSGIGTLIAIDEVAHFFAAINSEKAPSYLIELAGTMLQLFSASKGVYHTRVRAVAKGTVPSRAIQNPMINILGFATPEKLGEALGVGNIEDGLLGRFLFVFGQSGVVPRRVSTAFVLPDSAIKAADGVKMAEFSALIDCVEQPFNNAILIDPAAEARLAELLVEFDRQRLAANSGFAKALLTRSCEKCERVAGVLAVFDSPRQPVITLEHLAWAEQLIRASDSALLHFSGEYMHGGKTQANAKRVLILVKRALAGELKHQKRHEQDLISKKVAPFSMLMRASKLNRREFKDAVEHLLGLSEVTQIETTSKHPNGRAEKARGLMLRI